MAAGRWGRRGGGGGGNLLLCSHDILIQSLKGQCGNISRFSELCDSEDEPRCPVEM